MSTPDTAEKGRPIMVTQDARELVAAVVRSAHLRGGIGEVREFCAPEIQDAALEYIAQLELDRRRLTEYEEREAAVCPEDFGFEEVIASLRRDKARLNVLEEILLTERIASHGKYGILVRYDGGLFHQSKSLREAADAEIARRSNTGDTNG